MMWRQSAEVILVMLEGMVVFGSGLLLIVFLRDRDRR
jgi:hypothetical protein